MDRKKTYAPISKSTPKEEQRQGSVAPQPTESETNAPHGYIDVLQFNSAKSLNKSTNKRQANYYDMDAFCSYLSARCRYCQRGFELIRLSTHEEVCKKVITKKRQIFESANQRLSEIESELFHTPRWDGVTLSAQKETFKNVHNWRLEHDNFLKNIRSARDLQNHINNAAKMTHMPAPPANANFDYIKCSSCGRRFNQDVAERHVAYCVNRQRLMPKPRKATGSATRKPSQGKPNSGNKGGPTPKMEWS